MMPAFRFYPKSRLSTESRFIVSPAPPPTSLFHIYLRGDWEALNARRDQIARERRIWITHGFGPARIPGYADAELHFGHDSDTLSDDEAAGAAFALVGSA